MIDKGTKYVAQIIKKNKTWTHVLLYMNGLPDYGNQLLINAVENYNTTIEMSISLYKFKDSKRS